MNSHDFSVPNPPPGELFRRSQANAEGSNGKIHQCHVCSKTYERRDHLSRHLKSHQEQRSHLCPECGKGFHRGDLLTRHRSVHVKDVSADGQRRRTSKACQSCITAKTKCNEERPCGRCTARNEPCLPTQARVRALDKRDSEPNIPAGREDYIGEPNNSSNFSPMAQSTSHNSGLLAYQDLPDYGNAMQSLEPLQFPDFFDQIMNMSSVQPNSMHQGLLAPPNVSTFATDDFGLLLDYDFSLLADGLTRPSTAQGTRQDTQASEEMYASPQSHAQLRSEAIEKSPWGWNRWIPDKSHTTFSGQEINVSEQRVNADDQLTPGHGTEHYLTLDLQVRDRILRLATSVAGSRLAITSFPSVELLSDLLNVFVMQERDAIDSYVHWPSINCREIRTETLLAILAKGATYVALQPVWKIGLVFEEIVRMAMVDVFESDNSTTRQLQPLQAYLLYLGVGLWSGSRRKTEIASGFLQPGVAMLSWSDALTKHHYKEIEPSAQDDTAMNEKKWKEWAEQEAFKRLVLHTFIHDSQASLAHTTDPLLSPSRMQLPLPGSLELWRARDAESWRACYLSTGRLKQSDMPPVVALTADIQLLETYGHNVDHRLCTMLACHLVAYDVLQFRQQAAVFSCISAHSRRDRWLAHVNRQKEVYDDLSSMHTYCDMMKRPIPEAVFMLHYLMMLLHTAFDHIQLFSGKSGEREARRVYPLVKAWTEDAQSRTAIWHAGQALRAARSFEQTKLRDFYAVLLYHVTLTLWVYGMVKANDARTRGHTPSRDSRSHQPNPHRNGKGLEQDVDVLLDGEDGRQAKAFRHLGQGRPCLSRTNAYFRSFGVPSSSTVGQLCPLEQPKYIMPLASDILKHNFPESCSDLPPLVDNLVKLMNELARFSGRDTG